MRVRLHHVQQFPNAQLYRLMLHLIEMSLIPDQIWVIFTNQDQFIFCYIAITTVLRTLSHEPNWNVRETHNRDKETNRKQKNELQKWKNSKKMLSQCQKSWHVAIWSYIIMLFVTLLWIKIDLELLMRMIEICNFANFKFWECC